LLQARLFVCREIDYQVSYASIQQVLLGIRRVLLVLDAD